MFLLILFIVSPSILKKFEVKQYVSMYIRRCTFSVKFWEIKIKFIITSNQTTSNDVTVGAGWWHCVFQRYERNNVTMVEWEFNLGSKTISWLECVFSTYIYTCTHTHSHTHTRARACARTHTNTCLCFHLSHKTNISNAHSDSKFFYNSMSRNELISD